MAANGIKTDWGDEPTVVLKPYRTMPMGEMLIHVTPTGHHLVSMDCDGVCLDCNHPLEGDSAEIQAN